MIRPMFCNYDRDYQQRLGFLKLVCRVGEGARGGPQDILNRLKLVYTRTPYALPSKEIVTPFSPHDLLRHPDIPSWQPGFTLETLDHLVTWAKRIGIIAATGRVSEWGTILQGLDVSREKEPRALENPFLLSLRERAFFIQILFYHDQVFPFLLSHLSKLVPWTRVGVGESCVLITHSIGDFFNSIKGNSPDDIGVRATLRSVLERIGRKYEFNPPASLLSSEARAGLLKELTGKRKGSRNYVAEKQAVCRFEQLVDLGVLKKEGPELHPKNGDERAKARTSWVWYVTPGLVSAAEIISDRLGDIDYFLSHSWMQFCKRAFQLEVQRLNPFSNQLDMARHLDVTLPKARRQIGPIQMHTWASLACLHALAENQVMEISDVRTLLLAIHRDSRLNSNLRLSGQMTLRDTTVAVPSKANFLALLKENPIKREDLDEQR